MYKYYETYDYIKNIKCKSFIFEIIIIVSMFILLIISLTFKISDIYNVRGIIKDNSLVLISNPSETSNIIKTKYIKIDNKKYIFSVKNISDIMYDEYLNNYQEIELNTKLNHKEMVVDVKLYQNKETIIKKIYKLIF